MADGKWQTAGNWNQTTKTPRHENKTLVFLVSDLKIAIFMNGGERHS
jgi:hypothetical protein